MKRHTFIAAVVVMAIPVSGVSGIRLPPGALSKLGRAIGNVLSKFKTPVAAVSIAAIADVASAKVISTLEHVDANSPMLAIATYYSLLGARRILDAKQCWISPPEKHFVGVEQVEKFYLNDIRELYKEKSTASVWVSVSGKRYGYPSEVYSGVISLSLLSDLWMIESMKLTKN